MYWSITQNRFGQYGERTPIHVSRCAHCQKDSFWLKTAEGQGDDSGQGVMIIPAGSIAPMPHPEIPERVKADYLEARSIVNNSPRGASPVCPNFRQWSDGSMHYSAGINLYSWKSCLHSWVLIPKPNRPNSFIIFPPPRRAKTKTVSANIPLSFLWPNTGGSKES